jgi:protein gp37
MSKIQWTEKTWNPVIGCTRVSEGCRNCYAEKMANRMAANPMTPQYRGIAEGGRWTGEVRCLPEKLAEPLKWRKPCRVFVNSMSDLFHPDVPDEFIDQVFAVMAEASHHVYQILSKRPDRLRDYLRPAEDLWSERWPCAAYRLIGECEPYRFPLRNVHLGVSVEDQATANERIPLLLQTPAAVRFVSLEPLLGPVRLRSRWLHEMQSTKAEYQRPALRWAIVGGESGPKARPCDVAWIRSIVEQCRSAEVAAFVKQLGAVPFEGDGKHRHVSGSRSFGVVCDEGDPCPHCGKRPITWWPTLALRSRSGSDPDEWPEDLRVREYPEVTS